MISCLCAHYGRTWLLAEAVQSYLLQDFDEPSELVILNDHPAISLSVNCEPAGGKSICVVNWGARMATLSDKFDVLAELARYPLLCMWDDDDLSLPNRLAYSLAQWYMYGKPGYLSFDRHIYCDQRGPHIIQSGIHGGDLITREAYHAVGGSVGTGHNDQNLVGRIKDAGLFTTCENTQPFYVYRWANVGSHHSTRLALEDAMDDFDRNVRAHPKYQEGKVVVVPAYEPATVELLALAKTMVACRVGM